MVLLDHVISKDHVTKGSYDIKVGAEKISYHLAKFGSHRHFGSEDITFLVCHVILQDHTIKGSCDFMGRGLGKLPSCQVCWP